VAVGQACEIGGVVSRPPRSADTRAAAPARLDSRPSVGRWLSQEFQERACPRLPGPFSGHSRGQAVTWVVHIGCPRAAT
jgi:hypothetical protein